ncbi:uncharacterized protein LOC115045336 [Echeneis naucrates]|uniref:Uncharacterized LOC115045336 n=1 Tax=Echeneis naucrates TaxID=173247 RepID=A0A665UDS0_ECHNA|nr:uncharacterized protein LOC115045336 [Echeneis naucrates]
MSDGIGSSDEARAIEDAIRAAIDAVTAAMCSACSRRVQLYERMVADRDAEIRRLEGELSRRQTGVGAAPAHPSPKSHETAEAFPHQHAQSRITSLVKEEPSELETVIKWEVCEGSLLDQEGQPGAEERRRDTQADSGAKTANPLTSKPKAAEEEDKPAANLKRKGRERNGCHRAESEEEDAVMKKSCGTEQSAPKTTAPKSVLGDIGSLQLQGLSSNGSTTSNLNVQDPLSCQQQTYVSMAAPQAACDPILLEVLVSLETIKQQNSTVLQILQSGNSSAAPLCEPPDVGTLPLPLQSVQDLRSLEHRLSTEPELKKEMTSYLGLAGGMTTKESVWRIMAKLFTNTLAKNINWRGRNNKQKIENLTIKRVILNAVRQNSFCKDAVDEEIERYMKRWLQLAGDRDGGRKRRQEKGKEGNSMQDYCVDGMYSNVIE